MDAPTPSQDTLTWKNITDGISDDYMDDLLDAFYSQPAVPSKEYGILNQEFQPEQGYSSFPDVDLYDNTDAPAAPSYAHNPQEPSCVAPAPPSYTHNPQEPSCAAPAPPSNAHNPQEPPAPSSCVAPQDPNPHEEGMYVDGVLVPFEDQKYSIHIMHLTGKGFCIGPECTGCYPLRGTCKAFM